MCRILSQLICPYGVLKYESFASWKLESISSSIHDFLEFSSWNVILSLKILVTVFCDIYKENKRIPAEECVPFGHL